MNDRCPGFRRSLATFLAGIGGCGASAAFAAPTALSDSALDDVTAGSNERASVESGEPPVVVVADGARYTFHSIENVRLRADAQSGLRALNVTGAAGSDVGNAVNVLTGMHDASAVAQNNMLSQLERRSGSLGRATLAGTHVTQSQHTDSRFAAGRSTSESTGRRIQSALRTSETLQTTAFVPEFAPVENLRLTVTTPTLAPIEVPEFSIDLLNDDGRFGIEGSVGPFTILAPKLTLGTARLDGDDVVFDSGSVQLPGLNLGSAEVTVCFAACWEAKSNEPLGEFGGQTINIPGPDLRLEGANIFKDTHINAGFGIALVGTGTVNAQPGHLTLSGELSLDLPDPNFSFDFTIPSILEIDGEDIIGPWDFDGPDIAIEIPPITVSHDFIDEDIGFAYSATFDGVLCLALGTTDCGSASQRTERHEVAVDVAFDMTQSSAYSQRGGSTSSEIDTHAGASLRDAEADLVAMSKASAEVVTANTVTLDARAQRGMRSLNAVNAANAIIGNALNVAVPQPSRPVPGTGFGALNQSNAFSQYRTQYGL